MSLIDRSFSWLHRALIERPTQTRQLLRPDMVMPNVDILGTDKLKEADHVGVTGVADATTVGMGRVGEEEVWYVLAASLTSSLAANDPRIVLRDQAGNETSITTLTTTAFRVIAADRAFYVPPGFELAGTVATIPVGGQLTLRAVRVVLVSGEYIVGA